MSKSSVALGGMPHAGKPAAPYATSEVAVIRDVSPICIVSTPSSHAGITWPRPILKLKTFWPTSLVDQNSVCAWWGREGFGKSAEWVWEALGVRAPPLTLAARLDDAGAMNKHGLALLGENASGGGGGDGLTPRHFGLFATLTELSLSLTRTTVTNLNLQKKVECGVG